MQKLSIDDYTASTEFKLSRLFIILKLKNFLEYPKTVINLLIQAVNVNVQSFLLQMIKLMNKFNFILLDICVDLLLDITHFSHDLQIFIDSTIFSSNFFDVIFIK